MPDRSSLGGRTFRPEKPAWGFPMPLQYNRPLGFGNLARRVRGSEAFTYIHSRKTITLRVPFLLWTSIPIYIWEGDHHTTLG